VSARLSYTFFRGLCQPVVGRAFPSVSVRASRIYQSPTFRRFSSAPPSSPKPKHHEVSDEAHENPLGTGAVLRGPFGTLEDPVVVPSILESRIVGCLGHPDDPHDLTWHIVSEHRNAVCALCAQVFVFKRMELRTPKINWNRFINSVRKLLGYNPNLIDLRAQLEQRGLLLEENEDNFEGEFFLAALKAKGLEEHARFVQLCLEDEDVETLEEYIEAHDLLGQVREFYEKREVVMDENVDDHHHDHDHGHGGYSQGYGQNQDHHDKKQDHHDHHDKKH